MEIRDGGDYLMPIKLALEYHFEMLNEKISQKES
jgi:hypothetical protein